MERISPNSDKIDVDKVVELIAQHGFANRISIDLEHAFAEEMCNPFTQEERTKLDPEEKVFKSDEFNNIFLTVENNEISLHIRHTISDNAVIDLSPVQQKAILSSFPYAVKAYDKDANKHYLVGISDELETAKTLALLAQKKELNRTDKNRETRGVPDIDWIEVQRTEDDSVVGWAKGGGNSDHIRGVSFVTNNHERLLVVNDNKNVTGSKDLYLETVELLNNICGEDYETLDIRRKEAMSFVIPERYWHKLIEALYENPTLRKCCNYNGFTSYECANSFTVSYFEPECGEAYVSRQTQGRVVEMPVKINPNVLCDRMNDLTRIPSDMLDTASFYVRFERDRTYLLAEYGESESKEIPLTKNESKWFKNKADEYLRKNLSVDKLLSFCKMKER